MFVLLDLCLCVCLCVCVCVFVRVCVCLCVCHFSSFAFGAAGGMAAAVEAKMRQLTHTLSHSHTLSLIHTHSLSVVSKLRQLISWTACYNKLFFISQSFARVALLFMSFFGKKNLKSYLFVFRLF